MIPGSPVPDIDFLIIHLAGNDMARQGQYRKYVSIYLEKLSNQCAVREQLWTSEDGLSRLRMWFKRRERKENVFIERNRISAVGYER